MAAPRWGSTSGSGSMQGKPLSVPRLARYGPGILVVFYHLPALPSQLAHAQADPGEQRRTAAADAPRGEVARARNFGCASWRGKPCNVRDHSPFTIGHSSLVPREHCRAQPTVQRHDCLRVRRWQGAYRGKVNAFVVEAMPVRAVPHPRTMRVQLLIRCSHV